RLFAFLDMVLSQTQGGRSISPQLENALERVISELQALFEISHAMYDRNRSFNRDPEVVELSGLHDAAHCVAMRSGNDDDRASDSGDELMSEMQRGSSSRTVAGVEEMSLASTMETSTVAGEEVTEGAMTAGGEAVMQSADGVLDVAGGKL
ncbi:hypothetical protein THAOC_10308, partial [Thalassiosira oceanica]